MPPASSVKTLRTVPSAEASTGSPWLMLASAVGPLAEVDAVLVGPVAVVGRRLPGLPAGEGHLEEGARAGGLGGRGGEQRDGDEGEGDRPSAERGGGHRGSFRSGFVRSCATGRLADPYGGVETSQRDLRPAAAAAGAGHAATWSSSATCRSRWTTASCCSPTATRRPARGRAPTVLVRSPYGRRGAFGFLFGRLVAERGLQVVVQSIRGTFGSGGRVRPLQRARRRPGDAALATRAAVARRAGGDDRAELHGASCSGRSPTSSTRMAPSVTASQFRGMAYGGGSIALDTALSWMLVLEVQERRLAPLLLAHGLRRTPAQGVRPRADRRHRRARVRRARCPTSASGPSRCRPTARTGPRATSRPRSATCARRSSSSAAGTTSSCRGWSRTSTRCGTPGAGRS